MVISFPFGWAVYRFLVTFYPRKAPMKTAID
jgi:hypothetical protein